MGVPDSMHVAPEHFKDVLQTSVIDAVKRAQSDPARVMPFFFRDKGAAGACMVCV